MARASSGGYTTSSSGLAWLRGTMIVPDDLRLKSLGLERPRSDSSEREFGEASMGRISGDTA